jgi:hypothetical protein
MTASVAGWQFLLNLGTVNEKLSLFAGGVIFSSTP